MSRTAYTTCAAMARSHAGRFSSGPGRGHNHHVARPLGLQPPCELLPHPGRWLYRHDAGHVTRKVAGVAPRARPDIEHAVGGGEMGKHKLQEGVGLRGALREGGEAAGLPRPPVAVAGGQRLRGALGLRVLRDNHLRPAREPVDVLTRGFLYLRLAGGAVHRHYPSRCGWIWPV